MTRTERERFDALFEDVLKELPEGIHRLIEEVPIVLEDRPSPALLRELGIDDDDEILCGLHTGVPLTDRSVERADASDVVQIFREGVIDMAGGWEEWEGEDEAGEDEAGEDEAGEGDGGDGEGPLGGIARIREEIRITILHELGHHFGLDEDDLERLGYA
jgi:predicted Zn-dependent protease with MMP-like domain